MKNNSLISVIVPVYNDERFLQPEYLRMFPREWEKYEEVSMESISGRIERFWNEWL